MTGDAARPRDAPSRPRIIVMAKAPVPGRSKTRLVPPLTWAGAARIAEAALIDTLAAAATTPGTDLVMALDGRPGTWLPWGIRVISQRGNGLAERLAHAFERAGGPALAIDADTPQVTPELLGEAIEALTATGTDAVLGPAVDGGYWAIGLRRPQPAVFQGIPMSTDRTAAVQRDRFQRLGLRWVELQELRDVDRMADAVAVAEDAPTTRFAEVLRVELGTVGAAP